MNLVIGQEKLVKTLEGYTLQTAPRTILFLGQSGCGKTWIANAFAKQLNLEKVDIKPDATPEQLIDYYQCPIAKMYLIDLAAIDEKAQNKFLKFIEEPSSNMYVILMARSEIGVLPTILNRCVKFHFEEYTIDQLKQFDWALNCDDSIAYEICRTPGQLMELSDDKFNETFKLCETIVTKIKTANYANTLSLVLRINCKNDPNKLDFNLFLDLLPYVAFKNYKETNNEFSFNLYKYTIEQKAKILNKSVAKESFLLSFFDNVWRLAQ